MILVKIAVVVIWLAAFTCSLQQWFRILQLRFDVDADEEDEGFIRELWSRNQTLSMSMGLCGAATVGLLLFRYFG